MLYSMRFWSQSVVKSFPPPSLLATPKKNVWPKGSQTSNMKTGWLLGSYSIHIHLRHILLGGWPTRLKIWVRQIGSSSQLLGKIKFMFQTTKQHNVYSSFARCCWHWYLYFAVCLKKGDTPKLPQRMIANFSGRKSSVSLPKIATLLYSHFQTHSYLIWYHILGQIYHTWYPIVSQHIPFHTQCEEPENKPSSIDSKGIM